MSPNVLDIMALKWGTSKSHPGGLQPPVGKLRANGQLPALSFAPFNKPQTRSCSLQSLPVSPKSAAAYILHLFATIPGDVLFAFLYLCQILRLIKKNPSIQSQTPLISYSNRVYSVLLYLTMYETGK